MLTAIFQTVVILALLPTALSNALHGVRLLLQAVQQLPQFGRAATRGAVEMLSILSRVLLFWSLMLLRGALIAIAIGLPFWAVRSVIREFQLGQALLFTLGFVLLLAIPYSRRHYFGFVKALLTDFTLESRVKSSLFRSSLHEGAQFLAASSQK